MSNVSAALKRRVRERAQHRCEYCLIPDLEGAYAKHHIDHITAIQHGGGDSLSNLALACINCNLFKGPNLASKDPETGQITPFFNPRTQIWTEHFRLEDARIVALSAEARTTVFLFRLNEDIRIKERKALMAAELYPEALE